MVASGVHAMNTQLVDTLLTAGARPDLPNKNFMTPLTMAVV
jgi:hypothetical protein